MDRPNQVSGLGMLSMMLALAGMLFGVSQTEGWTLRTSANMAKSSTGFGSTGATRPANERAF